MCYFKEKTFCWLYHDITSIVRGILTSEMLKCGQEINFLESMKHGNNELE